MAPRSGSGPAGAPADGGHPVGPRPAGSRPDPTRLRVVLGAGGIATLSALITAIVVPPAPAARRHSHRRQGPQADHDRDQGAGSGAADGRRADDAVRQGDPVIAADRMVRTTRTPREARPTPIVPLSVATTAMGRVVHRPPMAFAGAGRTTNQHHPSPDRTVRGAQ